MADRLQATSDTTTSYYYDEEVFTFALANASSALTGSGGTVFLAGPLKANGRVADFFIGVGTPAVSASGFVSGTISANLRVNSVSALSTLPGIFVVGSAGNAGQQATNAVSTSAAGRPAATSAVVNSASANFSAGDFLLIDYNLASGASAAAGAAGTGFWATAKVRYAAS